MAGAENRGAQAVSHHKDRHDLFAVGDERDLGGPGKCAAHLADQSGVVNDCGTFFDLVRRTPVDDHLAAEGVATEVQYFRRRRGRADPLLHVQELAQLTVLGDQFLLCLHQPGVEEILVREALVLALQVGLADKEAAYP